MGKIWATGTQRELKLIKDFCNMQGLDYSLTNSFGRPRAKGEYQKLLVAYKQTNDITLSAKVSGFKYGTAHRHLKNAGLLKK